MIKFLALIASAALLTCTGAETPDQKKATHLDAPAAAKLLADKSPEEKPIVLDIRTPLEFKAKRIAKSRNIDFVARSFEAELAKLDKSKPYLVLCQSGSRSQRALATFQKLGFTRIYHLDGGILAWIAADLPVTP